MFNSNAQLNANDIAATKEYLKNRNNIDDFFSHAADTPMVVGNHFCYHELTMIYGNQQKTVTNGERQPWDEFWSELCENLQSFTK